MKSLWSQTIGRDSRELEYRWAKRNEIGAWLARPQEPVRTWIVAYILGVAIIITFVLAVLWNVSGH